MNKINRIINEMKKENIKQIIVSDKVGIYYLTGKKIEPGERLVVQ